MFGDEYRAAISNSLRSVTDDSAIHPPYRHRLHHPLPADRQNTPLDVLHANSTARLLAVTQVLESLARLDLKDADSADLQHLANASAILLRDSCDLLDVMGWRLQA
ncbi:hypothetical protein C4K18_2725 [Pseudomonas chlororaphis subsp. aurantiaca]|nr:hypothetical protein C4K18_2725 [Pseudomonas chlororaphis subsp. aurantiaca]